MFKKVTALVVIGVVVLFAGFMAYCRFTDNRAVKKTSVAVEKPAGTTAKMPKIKTVEEVPSEVIITEEKHSSVSVSVGAIVRPEYCWVREKPEKIVKNAPCIDGFVNLTDYGLANIKANIKVNKNEKGEDCVFIFDENDKEVEFRYISSLGDMFGRQTKPTVKLFAIGIIKTAEPYFIILECTNALNALEKGGKGNISLNPIANFVKKNKVRQVLEELYVAQENIDILFPESEKVALK